VPAPTCSAGVVARVQVNPSGDEKAAIRTELPETGPTATYPVRAVDTAYMNAPAKTPPSGVTRCQVSPSAEVQAAAVGTNEPPGDAPTASSPVGVAMTSSTSALSNVGAATEALHVTPSVVELTVALVLSAVDQCEVSTVSLPPTANSESTKPGLA